MKIRTIRLLAKEGTSNIYKNKLMSFASIMTVVAALFFLGILLLIAINITTNIESMKRDLEVTVFLNVSASAFEREEVVTYIEQQQTAGVVAQYRTESKEQAFENIRSELKNDDLLKGLTVENMPESFYIKLTNPAFSDNFIEKLKTFSGVNADYGIGYDKAELEKLEGFLKIFNFVIMALLVVLMIIAVFLISNTIRLTVFARRREIEIMKYVGALDSFIRWPFIVEGILIGFIGAALSFLLTSQAYTWLQNVLNSILISFRLTTLSILEFGPVALRIFMVYSIFGIIIGGIGSLLSVRKHLNV
jgi:cell division transport system permease protein